MNEQNEKEIPEQNLSASGDDDGGNIESGGDSDTLDGQEGNPEQNGGAESIIKTEEELKEIQKGYEDTENKKNLIDAVTFNQVDADAEPTEKKLNPVQKFINWFFVEEEA